MTDWPILEAIGIALAITDFFSLSHYLEAALQSARWMLFALAEWIWDTFSGLYGLVVLALGALAVIAHGISWVTGTDIETVYDLSAFVWILAILAIPFFLLLLCVSFAVVCFVLSVPLHLLSIPNKGIVATLGLLLAVAPTVIKYIYAT
ncbi:MAG: hypothetical protein AAF714_00810 [Pseudomonadota bacterium]